MKNEFKAKKKLTSAPFGVRNVRLNMRMTPREMATLRSTARKYSGGSLSALIRHLIECAAGNGSFSDIPLKVIVEKDSSRGALKRKLNP